MSVRVATVVAVVAALLETSVAPLLLIGGVKPDLVLICATVFAVAVGVEGGFICAFLGGLILDMLIAPVRPVGATVASLLVAIGVGAAAVRWVGPGRVPGMLLLVFVLTFLYHILLSILLAAVAHGPALRDPFMSILPIAIENTVVAVPVALAGRWAWLRAGLRERPEW